MTEVIRGSIPLTKLEKQALKTIRNVVSYSRTQLGEQGPLQVEDRKGGIWTITGRRVERIK